MYTLMIVVFVLGYLAIALEHPIKVDKAASALLLGVLCWTVYILGVENILDYKDVVVKLKSVFTETDPKLFDPKNLVTHDDYVHAVTHDLAHHLSEIAEILFFLIGAMTIVELVDAHEGFAVITDKVKTRNRVKLMWILCILTFFFSAVLDNLTTSIVMAALLKKLMKDKKDIWLFGGMVIIAANAGGAWSPIGDVTTIMLWIGKQVTDLNIITSIFLPSLVCLIVPLVILSFTLKGEVESKLGMVEREHLSEPTSNFERNLIFGLGVGALLFVPVFKLYTHLPPYMGILFGLGLLWLVTELLHKKKNDEVKSHKSVIAVLRKVDTPSVLFFLGILVGVAALQSAGHLISLAGWLDGVMNSNIYSINLVIGALSSIVDNVPLVAGAMGMYQSGIDIAVIPGVQYPQDHAFWEFLAYCAGTGGSCLIIGSAAGVAIMGILKIDFVWYLKRMSLLALVGYLSGAGVYILMN